MDTTTVIEVASNLASLILSVVAMAFAVWSYSKSRDSEARVAGALGRIDATTLTLQQLTDRQMNRLTDAVTGPRPLEEALIKSFLIPATSPRPDSAGVPSEALAAVALHSIRTAAISTGPTKEASVATPTAAVPEDVARPAERSVSERIVTGGTYMNEIQRLTARVRMSHSKGENTKARDYAINIVELVRRAELPNPADVEDRAQAAWITGDAALNLEALGLAPEAEEVYTKAISWAPDFAGCHYQYSDFLADQARYSEAELELTTARRLAPDDGRATLTAAKLAVKTGRASPAIEDRLRDEFRSNPGDSRKASAYLAYLAGTNASVEKVEAAAIEWEQALPESQKYQPERYLADYLAKKNEHARAAGIYETILPKLQGSERHDVLHNLATVLAALGKIREARRAWEEAYKLDPSDGIVRAVFSKFLQTSGELELAVKVAEGEPLAMA